MRSLPLKQITITGVLLMVFTLVTLTFLPPGILASHSWGGYHWARTSNPFNLTLADNLSSSWDPYLATASTDWSVSSVLNTQIVAGFQNPRRCRPTSGRVEVCNYRYGSNGWLGIAQIWASGSHITQGTAKVNDTYFSSVTYNTPQWKRLVMCQEVAHTFGLDHQDENFDNPNLGSCMDYTSDPDGPPSNEHPNQHDYDELSLIYAHLDSFTSLAGSSQKLPLGSIISEAAKNQDFENQSEWGRSIRDNGNVALFERDLGLGNKLFTFVIWAQQ
ncbi:MAG TPA: hypothetical protein VI819_03455 [Patescibacteria group bacterium]|nr:hypothetical protein [Patescibacteria group bacterium]